MTTPTTQQAEQLWVSAHEHVRKGDFASATRDLAACFQILQEHNDPRLPEVHRRWTEVHQLAVEEAAQGKIAPVVVAAHSPSLEAEAEAAANAGDLEGAIGLYEQALAARPDNELVAERLTELKNARPRAAELTSTAPVVAAEIAPIDDEALAAAFDLDAQLVPAIVRDEAVERSIAVEPIADDAPLSAALNETSIIDDELMAPVPAIVRDEAVERSIVVEPIADGEPMQLAPANAFMSETAEALARNTLSIDEVDFGGGDIHDAVTLIPQRPAVSVDDVHVQITTDVHAEAVATVTNNVPQWGADLLGATAESPIAADDSRFASFGDDVADSLPEPILGTAIIESVDDSFGTVEPAAAAAISGDDPRWGGAPAVDDTFGEASAVGPAAAATVSGDDPRWGGAPAVDDTFGEASGTVEPAAAVAAISGDDPRWGGPPAADDTFGEASGSVEPVVAAAISGDDPRWGGPPAHTAPLMDADDAPVGMPSLDIAIDMGKSVTPQQAEEMPVEVADDFEMMTDDDAAMIDETPRPAGGLALADGLPADPTAMLETILRRVRDNRRAA